MATPTVSPAAAKLFTHPPRVAVTTRMAGTWTIPFADALAAGESIVSVDANLVRVDPEPVGDVVYFVTAAVAVGTDARVSWTGEVLTAGELYRLEVSAEMSTGAVVERLRHIEVPA